MKKKFHDPLTYRHPRSLEEAFGPYERGNLYTKDELRQHNAAEEKLTAIISAIIAFVVIVFAIKTSA